MLLRLEDFCVPMKLVFRLEDRLRDDPERVRLAQALTLDSSRPRMGLRGTHGLFGSPEWWASIREGEIPLSIKMGLFCVPMLQGKSQVHGTIQLTWSWTMDRCG